MAAFPYQHPIFLLDSVFLPNTPTNKMPSSLEEGDMSSSCFSSYLPQPLQKNLSHVSIHETNCLDNNTTTTNAFNSDTEPSELDTCDDQVSHKKTPLGKKRKSKYDSSSVSAQSKAITVKEVKGKKQKKINNGEKETEEKKRKSDKKVLEEPPSGYIHVRARRGQATDSHSLAERVRREKISERMKLLQGLVPGCDKITGKAVMLDEIINYVQSLQYQVEFLSMKLASVNPVAYDFGADLDGLMVISEKVKSLGSSSTLPSSIHQSNLAQPTTFADTTPTTRNKYCIQDNAASLLLQQGQLEMLNAFSQDNENLLWDVDDHRQRFLNQCGFNNLCSFQ